MQLTLHRTFVYLSLFFFTIAIITPITATGHIMARAFFIFVSPFIRIDKVFSFIFCF